MGIKSKCKGSDILTNNGLRKENQILKDELKVYYNKERWEKNKYTIIAKMFKLGIVIHIELPFFKVNTHIMKESWERYIYEVLCFEIKIFKWSINFQITSKPKV